MTTVYAATLNDRFTLRSSSIAGLKSPASRIANRSFKPTDRMVVTGRTGGIFSGKFIFTRRNMSYADRGEWVECA